MQSLPEEFHLPSVSSTNDYAKELLHTHPYVFVSAMHQTAGRGRKGREWIGDFGVNAYCSIGIQHTKEPLVAELSSYMAIGALAAISSLRHFAPEKHFRIKYPNDVQAVNADGWAKIAGILVEHEFQGSRCNSTIVGIGVNIGQMHFNETIEQPCTSLALLNCPVSLPDFIQHIRSELNKVLQEDVDQVKTRWLSELAILGKRIRILNDSADWVVVKVLEDGRLVARNEVTQQERVISDGDTIRYQD